MTVRYIPKDRLLSMRVAGALLGVFGVRFMVFWTTYRLPFGDPIIAHPPGIDPMLPRYDWIREHELMHVEQQRGPWGLVSSALLYFLIPLPVLFSGRWFIEREPYLHDIQRGHQTPGRAAAVLWSSYFWPWPRAWMQRWFETRQ